MAGMGALNKLAVKVAKTALKDVPYFPPGSPERAANLARFREGSIAPPTLYHGALVHAAPMRTNTRPLGDIDQFDRYAAYKAFNRPEGMDAVGSWLSEGAGEFGAGMYAHPSEGAIYPIHASLKNPWKPKSFDEFLDLMHTTAGRNPKAQNPKGRGTVGPLREYLFAKGHDAIQFPPGIDDRRAPPVWVALRPERQLKSAIGNRGTFDLNDPDINKAHGGRVSSFAVRR